MFWALAHAGLVSANPAKLDLTPNRALFSNADLEEVKRGELVAALPAFADHSLELVFSLTWASAREAADPQPESERAVLAAVAEELGAAESSTRLLYSYWASAPNDPADVLRVIVTVDGADADPTAAALADAVKQRLGAGLAEATVAPRHVLHADGKACGVETSSLCDVIA